MAEKRYEGPQRRRMRRCVVRKCKIVYRRRILGVLLTAPVKGNAIRNLSSKGISFRSKGRLRRGLRMVITFEAPMLMHLFPPHFPITGRVVWCDRPRFKDYYRVGMKFDRLNRKHVEELRQFIRDAMINPHRAELYE